jgi:hypothetical protein
MRNARIGVALAAVCVAAVSAAASHGSPWRATSSEQAAAGRRLLASPSVLTPADTKAIQAMVRSALAGKYVAQTVTGGTGPGRAEDRDDEYLLDGRARVLYHRYPVPDTARPGVMRYTILEFTDVPAIRCWDRSPLPGKRLGFTYYEDWTGWHLGNPMVVDEAGSPWATESPGYAFLHAPPENLDDIGVHQIQGRSARGFKLTGVAGEAMVRTVWVDTASVLPIEETIAVTLGGKRFKTSTVWSYPSPRPITRPKDVRPPDCA